MAIAARQCFLYPFVDCSDFAVVRVNFEDLPNPTVMQIETIVSVALFSTLPLCTHFNDYPSLWCMTYVINGISVSTCYAFKYHLDLVTYQIILCCRSSDYSVIQASRTGRQTLAPHRSIILIDFTEGLCCVIDEKQNLSSIRTFCCLVFFSGVFTLFNSWHLNINCPAFFMSVNIWNRTK